MTCIPRADMPQVDMDKIPHLLTYLNGKGIATSFVYAPTFSLRARQCFREIQAVHDREVLGKPILVCADLHILDGHSRWATFRQDGRREIPAFLFHAPFDAALEAVRHYAGAYSYGDGAFHPISY